MNSCKPVMYVTDKAEMPHWPHTTYSLQNVNFSPESLKSCQVRSILSVFNPHQRIYLFVLERERKKKTLMEKYSFEWRDSERCWILNVVDPSVLQKASGTLSTARTLS